MVVREGRGNVIDWMDVIVSVLIYVCVWVWDQKSAMGIASSLPGNAIDFRYKIK